MWGCKGSWDLVSLLTNYYCRWNRVHHQWTAVSSLNNRDESFSRPSSFLNFDARSGASHISQEVTDSKGDKGDMMPWQPNKTYHYHNTYHNIMTGFLWGVRNTFRGPNFLNIYVEMFYAFDLTVVLKFILQFCAVWLNSDKLFSLHHSRTDSFHTSPNELKGKHAWIYYLLFYMWQVEVKYSIKITP